jgi:hypothetical protein
MSRSLIIKALIAGLISGSLDIIAAFIQTYVRSGKGPAAVLEFIASGAFRRGAFTSETMLILLGLIFHFIIALSFTLIFFWLADTFPKILERKIITAFLYSVFMWCVTQFIVIPLSKIPSWPFNLTNAIIAVLILFICIGIPIAYLAANALKGEDD